MDRLPLQEDQLMHRFFADPGRCDGDSLFLTEDEARHAVTVLRLKTGQHIEVILNNLRYEAEITCMDRRDVNVRLICPLPSTEPVLSVTLFQGLPKGDKMDLIVQKSTELGISRIVPVIMSRCVAKMLPYESARRLERWNRISREAVKQSCRSVIPMILPPVALQDLSCVENFPSAKIVPWENASGYGPLAFRNEHPSLSSLGILVGPEGGIEEEEIRFLQEIGFVCITLGKRILRTETAGLAAVAAFMGLYGEME